MTETDTAIATCVEYLRGLAAIARLSEQPQHAAVLERAADALWRDKARLSKQTEAAFGWKARRVNTED